MKDFKIRGIAFSLAINAAVAFWAAIFSLIGFFEPIYPAGLLTFYILLLTIHNSAQNQDYGQLIKIQTIGPQMIVTMCSFLCFICAGTLCFFELKRWELFGPSLALQLIYASVMFGWLFSPANNAKPPAKPPSVVGKIRQWSVVAIFIVGAFLIANGGLKIGFTIAGSITLLSFIGVAAENWIS